MKYKTVMEGEKDEKHSHDERLNSNFELLLFSNTKNSSDSTSSVTDILDSLIFGFV